MDYERFFREPEICSIFRLLELMLEQERTEEMKLDCGRCHRFMTNRRVPSDICALSYNRESYLPLRRFLSLEIRSSPLVVWNLCFIFVFFCIFFSRVIYIMQSNDRESAVRFLLNVANKVAFLTEFILH